MSRQHFPCGSHRRKPVVVTGLIIDDIPSALAVQLKTFRKPLCVYFRETLAGNTGDDENFAWIRFLRDPFSEQMGRLGIDVAQASDHALIGWRSFKPNKVDNRDSCLLCCRITL